MRAYKYALKGKKIELAPREVFIRSLLIEEYLPPVARVRVVCSKGTYIRSLARDLAEALQTCAFVRTLKRVRIGGFTLAEAVSPHQFDAGAHLLGATDFIGRLGGVTTALVLPEHEEHLMMGKTLDDGIFREPLPEGLNAVFTERQKLIAVVSKGDGKISYKMVLKD
jgi:tRNA pseudouridine55 synthase